MDPDLKPYVAVEGERLKLSDRPTRVEPVYASKADYHDILKRRVKRLKKLQRAHYAAQASSLLVIFQAMDAAGKDGAIRHVMSGVNPQGCQVSSFKAPSAEELRHDFLWRTTLRLPERGMIGIFNRSCYEEVLVVRVHPEMLEAEKVEADEADRDAFWKHRYASIADQEKHLSRNGCRIIKIFLHLSKDEQARRFLKRIDDPDRNWKFSASDMAERDRFGDYMKAYEEAISATTTKHAPWFVIPADDKKTARLLVSQAVVEALAGLHPKFPDADPEALARLDESRAKLEAELG